MKLLTQDQLDDANNVFLVNGAKGALGCFALSAAAVTLLPRYTRFGKTLTIPLKAFFISSLSTAGFVIQGEHALVAYDRAQFAAPVSEDQKNEIRAQLSPLLRAKNYVSEYRYYIVAGSWVGGMSLAGLYLYRKKYMTPTQKLVEARMYAQAITLGSLAAVAAFSSGATTDPKSEKYSS